MSHHYLYIDPQLSRKKDRRAAIFFVIATIIFGLIVAIPMAYVAGRNNPMPELLAKAKAVGYDAGRQDVINTPPSVKQLDRHCASWLMESNLLETRRRICGK